MPPVKPCRSTSPVWPAGCRGGLPCRRCWQNRCGAPCLQAACPARTSHRGSTLEKWSCGTQKYTPARALPGTRAAMAERLLPELPGALGWGAAVATPSLLPSTAGARSPAPHPRLLLPPTSQKCPPTCLVSPSPANHPKHTLEIPKPDLEFSYAELTTELN